MMIAAPGLCIGFLGASPAYAENSELLQTNTPMSALKDKDYGKGRLKYPDYVETASGLQYKDFREGSGPGAKVGDLLVLDWDGYTIGYYGRPFEARNKPKGSSFAEDKDFIRYKLGSGTFIKAFEEALVGMKVGGIRRLIVPEELGYPNGDYKKFGPSPSTFAGERALGFVLENKGMIDKTLLFDVEIKSIAN
jgi:FKBP-type peptidyl-prolyl cis-trans isomerase